MWTVIAGKRFPAALTQGWQLLYQLFKILPYQWNIVVLVVGIPVTCYRPEFLQNQVTWHHMCFTVLLSLCVDNHSTPHQWWEKGGYDRGIKLCDRDAWRKCHLLYHFSLHSRPEIFHIYFTRCQEFWPGKLNSGRGRGRENRSMNSL